MKDGVFSEKLLELVVRVVVGILNEFWSRVFFFLFENFLSPSYSCLQNIDHIGSYAF